MMRVTLVFVALFASVVAAQGPEESPAVESFDIPAEPSDEAPAADPPAPAAPQPATPGAPAAATPGAEEPAASFAPPEEPAMQPPIAGDPSPEGGGTTIIGDQESPIGLYIMPWRNAEAEEGLGRPARLLQEAMLPIDRDVFMRQVDYYETLAAHRAKQAAKAAPAP